MILFFGNFGDGHIATVAAFSPLRRRGFFRFTNFRRRERIRIDVGHFGGAEKKLTQKFDRIRSSEARIYETNGSVRTQKHELLVVIANHKFEFSKGPNVEMKKFKRTIVDVEKALLCDYACTVGTYRRMSTYVLIPKQAARARPLNFDLASKHFPYLRSSDQSSSLLPRCISPPPLLRPQNKIRHG